MSNWIAVDHNSPCAECNKGTWCARSADGELHICKRGAGDGSIERQDSSGAAYWLYRTNASAPRREAPDRPVAAQPERCDSVTLDRVYRGLLSKLGLSSEHRQALRARGLNDSQIAGLSYRTLPDRYGNQLGKALVEEFGADVCGMVPGIVNKEGRYGPYWSVYSLPGLLFPINLLYLLF